jgi:proteasome lid subunit RPN8/RPN11
MPNVSPDPHRFVIDPPAHIEGRRNARARGLSVIGFYHSHPHSPPAPSATDLAEASYADHLYLIVSVAQATAEMRAFWFRAGAADAGAGGRARGNFVETPVVTEP